MYLAYSILALFGVGGLALAYAVWRWVRSNAEKEVLKDDMGEKDALLKGLGIANKARMRLESDDAYAKRVRDKFTRRNP